MIKIIEDILHTKNRQEYLDIEFTPSHIININYTPVIAIEVKYFFQFCLCFSLLINSVKKAIVVH